MIPNKRDLKAFIRLDGQGRVVAGSLILRKRMPKVGKWYEIPAYECCNEIINTNTTTSTTTIIPCADPDCATILTVGTNNRGAYGYGVFSIGGEDFGSINPSCFDGFDHFSLTWSTTGPTLFFLTDLNYSSVIIQIDNQEFNMIDAGFIGGAYWWYFSTENPFPAVGETCNIRICAIESTTTTTTTIL